MRARFGAAMVDRSRLALRLTENRPLLADGAVGSNLFEMGLTPGEAPELWLDAHPDRVASLHKSFVDAGADIVLTNSFGGNARRLAQHDLQDRLVELNAKAARLARGVADAAIRPVIVAGAVGPTGERLAPYGPLAEADAVGVFVEQMRGLKEGGADVIWIETMWAAGELRAAATAAARVGMPYTLTASFDQGGRTMTGMAPAALVEFAAGLAPPPLAVGSNCGAGAAGVVVDILAMTAAPHGLPVIAKANAGIPDLRGGRARYPATPETMARYAHLALDAGARIVGGCCGTTPAHLAAMRRALDTHERGSRPDRAVIEARLGALAAPRQPPGAGGE